MYGSNFCVTNTEIECTDLLCVKMEQKRGDLICETHYWALTWTSQLGNIKL